MVEAKKYFEREKNLHPTKLLASSACMIQSLHTNNDTISRLTANKVSRSFSIQATMADAAI
jgi:hypothetical protein